MDKKIHIDITRAFAGRMASRLRDFLSQRGPGLRQSSAYQVIAIMLGYRDWNTMSAELGPDEDRYSDEALDNWLPTALGSKYDALNFEGTVVIAIPSADQLIQAVADARALINEDDRRGQYLVLVDDPGQWVSGDDDDFFSVMDFPPEWRHQHNVGVNRLIDLRFDRQLIIPLADAETLSFASEAAGSAKGCWCFAVADSFGDAVRQLVQSDSYVDMGGMNDVSVLMWPFAEVAEVRDNGSWRPILRSQLRAKDAAEKARWPMTALKEKDFNEVFNATEAAERRVNEWRAREREINPGKFIFTPDDIAPLEKLEENVRKWAVLEALHPFAQVELRALIRLGQGKEEGRSWPTVLGRSYRDLARAQSKPSDFLAMTPNLSHILTEGLRIAREMAV